MSKEKRKDPETQWRQQRSDVLVASSRHGAVAFTESTVESAALAWLGSLGYAVLHGPDISPGGDPLTPTCSQREREDYGQVVLDGRLIRRTSTETLFTIRGRVS